MTLQIRSRRLNINYEINDQKYRSEGVFCRELELDHTRDYITRSLLDIDPELIRDLRSISSGQFSSFISQFIFENFPKIDMKLNLSRRIISKDDVLSVNSINCLYSFIQQSSRLYNKIITEIDISEDYMSLTIEGSWYSIYHLNLLMLLSSYSNEVFDMFDRINPEYIPLAFLSYIEEEKRIMRMDGALGRSESARGVKFWNMYFKKVGVPDPRNLMFSYSKGPYGMLMKRFTDQVIDMRRSYYILKNSIDKVICPKMKVKI